MAGDYFSLIAETLRISIGLVVIILMWSMAWKLIALWKSARKGSLVWFIVLALVNTLGILEILYIFIFSKMKCCEVKSKNKVKTKSKKRKRK